MKPIISFLICVLTIQISQSQTTEIIADQCNSTLVIGEQFIYCNPVASAELYQFQFTPGSGSIVSGQTVSEPQINFMNIPNLEHYDELYLIQVKAKVAGNWGPWSSGCFVTFPDSVVDQTSIISTQCGHTLTSMTDVVHCNQVTNANTYEFKLEFPDNSYQVIQRSDRNFIFNSVSGVQQGATYQISVRAQVGTTWGQFGQTCAVSAPTGSNASTTQVVTAQCGSTLNSLDETISCEPVASASSYKFKVSTLAGSQLDELTSASPSFVFSDANGVTYNQNYNIEAQAFVGGQWSGYSTSCTVQTPQAAIENTKLINSDCHASFNGLHQTIECFSVSNASMYSFELKNASTNQIIELTSSSTSINLNESHLDYSSSYEVRVKAQVNSHWGNYSDICLIHISAAPITTANIEAQFCNQRLDSLDQFITCNQVTNASDYMFRFEYTSSGIVHEIESPANYFNMANLPGIGHDQIINIQVKGKVNGSYLNYDQTCQITTAYPPLEPTQLRTQDCSVSLSSLNASLQADLIQGASNYRFLMTFENQDQLEHTDSRGVLDLTQVGIWYDGYMQVQVAIQVNNQWSHYGSTCQILLPENQVENVQVLPSMCGTTLESPNSALYCLGVTGAEQFRWKLDDRNGNVFEYTREIAATDLHLHLINGLIYENTYFISVLAKVNGIWGTYADACEITIPAQYATSIEQKNTQKAPQFYPNPIKRDQLLTVEAEQNSLLEIQNLKGQSIYSNHLRPGINNIQLPPNLPSSTYLLVFKSEQSYWVKKLNIQP